MTVLDVEAILRKKSERRARLESSLRLILPQLDRLGAVKAVVFGSFADGSTYSRSDLDLLVIMPPERSGKEWSRIIYEKLDRGVAVDILVFNADELAEELKTNVFLQEIMENGRLVFEKKP